MKFTSGLLCILAVSLSMSSVMGFTGTAQSALNVRSSPSTHGNVISLFGPGAQFDIDCQVNSEMITGSAGTTNVWYHVPARGGFVSGAWVSNNGQSAPSCGPAKVNTERSEVLHVRAAPNTHSAILSSLPPSAEIDIDCQATGDNISGPSGTTNVWYHVPARGGYVSGAFVSTGGRSYSACGNVPAPTPAPTPSGADCSAGLRNPRTCSEAVAWAESHLTNSYNSEYRRLCDHFVGLAYGRSASGFASAIVHWNTTPERFRHYDRTPPAGALVFFRSGEYGHAALSTGGGNIISTDINGPGTLTRSSIAQIESKWRAPYLGWTNPYFHNA